ncbi:class GN sortase [Shewanella sp. GutDb-MelDb]|uniref:class GN sortase n=1 Tax=Shewanella sp. GutDb-MelDb TaxID=2058316 RepID=UPI0035B568C6
MSMAYRHAAVRFSFTYRRLHIGFTCLLFILGLTFVSQGAYMQAKAYFAQFLIQQAWQKTLDDQQQHKPWSWADTYPVAKLEFIASNSEVTATPIQRENASVTKNRSLYVLSGASGRNLAFGPAQVLSSAKINSRGNTVIAGHRDTHFSLLSGTQIGQLITLQNAEGIEVLYQVMQTQVVHESDVSVMDNVGETKLTLVTCYPFDSAVAGGPLRYVVTAVPFDKVEAL